MAWTILVALTWLQYEDEALCARYSGFDGPRNASADCMFPTMAQFPEAQRTAADAQKLLLDRLQSPNGLQAYNQAGAVPFGYWMVFDRLNWRSLPSDLRLAEHDVRSLSSSARRNKPGPKATTSDRIQKQMLIDYAGRPADLKGAKQSSLAAEYECSGDTARRCRAAALVRLRQNSA